MNYKIKIYMVLIYNYNLMQELILKLITLVHIMFILFVIIAPFTNSNYILLLHAIFVPFMMLHWLLNDNTCVLTIIERNLRKQIQGEDNYDENDCFTCKLIEPIYDFNKNYETFSKFIYIFTIILWSISVGKLYCKYKSGDIGSFKQLFNV